MLSADFLPSFSSYSPTLPDLSFLPDYGFSRKSYSLKKGENVTLLFGRTLWKSFLKSTFLLKEIPGIFHSDVPLVKLSIQQRFR